MGYILVKPEVLENNGIMYYNTIPDGRAIADISLLKTLGSIDNLELVASASELDAKINRLIEERRILKDLNQEDIKEEGGNK